MSKVIDIFKASRPNEKDSSKAKYIALLRPHIPLLYRKALLWSGTQENAEDLVQEVLIKMADRVDEMTAIDNLAPWLLKILYRQFVDAYRKQERNPEVSESTLFIKDADTEQGQSFLDNVPDEQDFTEIMAERGVLAQALRSLDKDMRKTFLLLEYKGYSIEETAHLMKEKPGTIKSRNHRAKQKLKKLLASGTFPASPSC